MFRTERLIIAPLEVPQIGAFLEDTSSYETRVAPWQHTMYHRRLTKLAAHVSEFTIRLIGQEEAGFIGGISLFRAGRRCPLPDEAELMYHIAPRHQRKGYATEAISRITEAISTQSLSPITTIRAFIENQNEASIRTAQSSSLAWESSSITEQVYRYPAFPSEQ
ncbi:hypothetical protein CSA80_01555 [Candidatus Saccharibacteria bacterium]|nr:MAG: hypothetical protein CSA80_01555 [Candidatus Saccharibacteria bacterium]